MANGAIRIRCTNKNKLAVFPESVNARVERRCFYGVIKKGPAAGPDWQTILAALFGGSLAANFTTVDAR
jgi:hypothetical protein